VVGFVLRYAQVSRSVTIFNLKNDAIVAMKLRVFSIITYEKLYYTINDL